MIKKNGYQVISVCLYMCMLTHAVAGQVILSSFGGMALLWYFIFVCTWSVCLMPIVTVVYFDLMKFFLQFCCQSIWFVDSHAKHSMKGFFFLWNPRSRRRFRLYFSWFVNQLQSTECMYHLTCDILVRSQFGICSICFCH